MNRLIWLVGAVVIVLFSIGHFDLRWARQCHPARATVWASR